MWFDPIVHINAKVVMYAIFYVAMLYYYLQFRRSKKNQILFQNKGFHFWISGILVFRFCTLFYIWYNFSFLDYGRVTFFTTDYLLVAEFIFHLFIFIANFCLFCRKGKSSVVTAQPFFLLFLGIPLST